MFQEDGVDVRIQHTWMLAAALSGSALRDVEHRQAQAHTALRSQDRCRGQDRSEYRPGRQQVVSMVARGAGRIKVKGSRRQEESKASQVKHRNRPLSKVQVAGVTESCRSDSTGSIYKPCLNS